MTITTKGQVTIPQRIRNRFGLMPGTQVEFVADGNKVVLQRRRKGRTSAEEWLSQATGVVKRRTTSEIMILTRSED